MSLRDGSLVVGIPNADTLALNDDRGAAMVYAASGPAVTPQTRIMNSTGGIGDKFGTSVGVSGGVTVVGSPLRNTPTGGTDRGSAVLFRRAGVAWSQDVEVFASDGGDVDTFGSAVAISGSTVVTGAPKKNVGTFADQGGSYVFRLQPRSPVLFEDSFE